MTEKEPEEKLNKHRCKYDPCAEEYNVEDSDAEDINSFCSEHCEISYYVDNIPF